MTTRRAAQFDISWHDSGRWPRAAPDPDYPSGIDLDVSGGASITCTTALPYPAKRMGSYLIVCRVCALSAVCTTAGRPDDPRSIKLRCKRMASA